MAPSDYKLVFEIGLRSFPWMRIVTPLIGMAVGFVLVRFLKRKLPYLITGGFFLSFGLLLLLISLMTFVPEFIELRGDYLSGQTSTVTGVVDDFRPAPELGPARESFSVSGVFFSYNVLDDTPCFHNAPLHHGPIREGLNVRISYDNRRQCIQRIEVKP